MPTLHVVRESKIEESFRVAQIRGMFDYTSESVRHEWSPSLPTEEKEWSIGLIVGPSGSGKTTLSRELFPNFYFHEQYNWPETKAVVDGFNESLDVKAITKMFNAVGFSSPPSWLKPFGHLSNGQKFRVELARCLVENDGGVIFDEFTSVIDRDVAKIGCAAISKSLRRKENSPPFVAVSCHYDIIDWLNPDWVYDVGSDSFEWRGRRRFPEIRIDICKASREDWRLFREHHYLDRSIINAAQCYIAMWGNKPVGFCSIIHFPHYSAKNLKREHRTVVLPDFQGIGIGNRLSEFVASIWAEKGFRVKSTTSNPAMIHHRVKSPNWRMTRCGRVAYKSNPQQGSGSKARITAGFEYVGPQHFTEPKKEK